MSEQRPEQLDLALIAQEWGHHPVEAFLILGEGLRHASRTLGREGGERADRHLSAQELVDGVIDLMVDRCGMLASAVLASWNITSADDLGALTYHLIERGILGKQDSDDRQDFQRIAPLSQLIEDSLNLRLRASLA